jgi:hypothetical protein
MQHKFLDSTPHHQVLLRQFGFGSSCHLSDAPQNPSGSPAFLSFPWPSLGWSRAFNPSHDSPGGRRRRDDDKRAPPSIETEVVTNDRRLARMSTSRDVSRHVADNLRLPSGSILG